MCVAPGVSLTVAPRESDCYFDVMALVPNDMDLCGHEAVLVITRDVEGTATSVARSRTELTCDKPAGHEGMHAHGASGETWDGKPGIRTTLLRHEGE